MIDRDETAKSVAGASAHLICRSLPDLMRMSPEDRYKMMTDYLLTAFQAYIDAKGGWRGPIHPSKN